MRVLVTNVTLAGRSGTETFVRDLALGLRLAGHEPFVYSPELGAIADEIRAAGAEVVDDLTGLGATPDIIHGHHATPTIDALIRFPGAPAIFMVHDRLSDNDTPPQHPRIRRYVAVDDNCRERLPSGHDTVIRNAVDLDRFRARGPLPDRPRRALVFSNYATERTVVAAIREACGPLGVELDTAGLKVGGMLDRPEDHLGRYDLVFGKARCALEALAVGCAVVLCDERGVGGLVTPEDLERQRRFNFGMKLLVEPVTAGIVSREMRRYDAARCAAVSARVRVEAGLSEQVAQFVALYRDVRSLPPAEGDEGRVAARLVRDLRRALQDAESSIRELAGSGTMKLRRKLLGIPLVSGLARGVVRLMTPGRPAGARAGSPMPFIVGVPRSGTTLLRLMLDAHPALSIPPETGWLPLVRSSDDPPTLLRRIVSAPEWPDFHLTREALGEALRELRPFAAADGVRAFFRLYAARFGKSRWGEKTPGYGLHMERIEALLPEARFIHVIRDGRDVAASVRTVWFRPGDTMDTIAGDWCERIRAARAQRVRHILEVRYEELVERPEPVLRRLCGFIDLPFDASMLQYHRGASARLAELEARPEATKAQRLAQQRLALEPPDPTRIGRWRRELTPEEVARFHAVGGPLLRDLGYPVEGLPRTS